MNFSPIHKYLKRWHREGEKILTQLIYDQTKGSKGRVVKEAKAEEWCYGAPPSCSCCYAVDTAANSAFLSNFQANQADEPTPAIESMIDNPAQRVTLTNVDNLSPVGRWPVSAPEEPIVFMTRSEVEFIMRREKRSPMHHRSVWIINLLPRLQRNHIWSGTSLYSFKILMEEEVKQGSMLFTFSSLWELMPMIQICAWESSQVIWKTWLLPVNLKPWSVHDWSTSFHYSIAD